MKIGGLQKLTLIDYPGLPGCTVFLAGCDFRCPWCHSSDLVLSEKIAKLPQIKKEDFFNFLKKRTKVLEGVVICGGEPTIHQELPDFIKKIVALGYKVKLDTNGSIPEMLAKVIPLVDYIAMDVKAPLYKYSSFVGVSVDPNKLKRSIEMIKKMKDYEFRTTVLPIHSEKDLLEIVDEIKGAKRYYLQKFEKSNTVDPAFSGDVDLEFIKNIFEKIKDNFDICEIR